MQRNRPPVHGGSAAPNPYYSTNLNPVYLQYSNPNHPPYYPQPIIPIPNHLHHPQQLSITNGFNSRIQLPGAVPNPAMFFYPFAESSNSYNAPPSQLGLAYAYPQTVASASAPSALAAAVAAVMAAYRQESNPARITLNPHSNGVAIQPNVAETFVAANPKPTSGVTIQPNVAETFVVAANPEPPTFSKKIKRVKKVNTSKKAHQIQSLPPGWCEVCKIDCNSESVLLNSHRLGKKHKKNLEKLAITSKKRIAAANIVDVERKNKKMLEGGVASGFVVAANPEPPTFSKKIKTVNTSEKAHQIQSSQPGWCEVCKIDCNSESVLNSHRLGKKHKKNLEKLAITSKKRIAAANMVDVERKKKKLLEGGVASGSVRTCNVCKVVCNSETVFKLHLEGSKHAAALMKKHGSKDTVDSTSKGKNGKRYNPRFRRHLL